MRPETRLSCFPVLLILTLVGACAVAPILSANTDALPSANNSSSSRSLLAVEQFTAPCAHARNGPLDAGVTSCLQWQQAVGCSLLEAQGYIAAGGQSFAPAQLTGNFTSPGTCGSAPISLLLRQGQHQHNQQQQSQQLVFDVGSRTALALVVKGAATSTYLLAQGVSKGVISLSSNQQPTGVELCLAPPGEGSVTATQTAAYTPRLAPGSVSWQLKKSVQLPPAFADGVVHMIKGDSVEAVWTLSATKSGEEASYQGMVSGSVRITNGRPVPVAVYGVLTAVKGGPSAVVSCGPTSMPFQVPACTTTVCSFTAAYPQPPAAGAYKATTAVQYQLPNAAHVAVAAAEATFQVSAASASLAPAAAKIPRGQAVVSDSQLPGQVLSYTGSGQQSFVTTLTCPPSGTVIASATLLAATGQEAAASASLQKNCQQLDVRLVDVGDPVVARWHWSVQQTASMARLALRSASTLYHDNTQAHSPVALDAEAERLPTTEDVTYTVHVTRGLPKGADGRVAPFTLTGKVLVSNPAPMNARLASVTVSIADPAAGPAASPLTVAASCPLLVVASGQNLVCSWTATPQFNPVGGAVVAVARYIAKRNGAGPSGETVDFSSAPVTVGDGGGGGDDGSTTAAALADISPDGLATFGGTFYGPGALVGSLSRTLKQWMGSSSDASSSSQAAFNPADFLGRVWGHTGATTIISGTAATAALSTFAAPAATGLGHSRSSSGSISSSGYAAPAALPNLQGGGRAPPHGAGSGSGSRLQQVQLAPAAGAAAAHSLPHATAHAAVDPHRRVAAAAPATAAAAAATAAAPPPPPAVEPVGLLDDCVELSHDLGFEPGLLAGRVVSGRPPTGRVCNSTVFVYSVRYGPYDSCSTASRAATAARLITADTRRVGSSIAEVELAVKGCRPGVQAVLAAARPAADVVAAWSVQVHAQHATLQLQPGQAVNNSYSVSYSRRLEASAPRLYAVMSVRNTGHTAALIGDGSYSLNMTCGAVSHARSNPFACAANKVAAGDAVNCSFVVPLACAANGTLQVQLQLSSGQTVHTPVAAFAAPDLEQLLAAQPARSGCVKALYGDGAGAGGGAAGGGAGAGGGDSAKQSRASHGKLVAGDVPAGRLCSPRTFSFTRQFGPFASCGHRSAHVKAGFSTPDGLSRSETLLTGLQVGGCSSSAGKAKGEVRSPAASSSNMRLAKQHRQHAAKAVAPAAASKHHAAAAGSGSQALAASGGSKKAVSATGTSASSNKPPPPATAAVSEAAVFIPPRGSCVYQPYFWKHCMLGDLPGAPHPACDVIAASLPGGRGARTPFFPYRKQPQLSKRTYRQLMVAPKSTGNKHVDAHFQAAKVYIAAQLNQFLGVTLPPRVREAYVQLGRDYFSVYDDRSAAQLLPSQPQTQVQLATAAQVLADFVGGKHPGLPTCAALVQEGRQRQRQRQKQQQQQQ